MIAESVKIASAMPSNLQQAEEEAEADEEGQDMAEDKSNKNTDAV